MGTGGGEQGGGAVTTVHGRVFGKEQASTFHTVALITFVVGIEQIVEYLYPKEVLVRF